jgi:hypothetical protein
MEEITENNSSAGQNQEEKSQVEKGKEESGKVSAVSAGEDVSGEEGGIFKASIADRVVSPPELLTAESVDTAKQEQDRVSGETATETTSTQTPSSEPASSEVETLEVNKESNGYITNTGADTAGVNEGEADAATG